MSSPPIWEYRVAVLEMYPSIECAAQLNEWGKEGWELVAVVVTPDMKGVTWPQAVMKRQISN